MIVESLVKSGAYDGVKAQWFKDIATAFVASETSHCVDPSSGLAYYFSSMLSEDDRKAALRDGIQAFIMGSFSGDAAQKDVLIGFLQKPLSPDSFEDLYRSIDDNRLLALSEFACNTPSFFTTENIALVSSTASLLTSVGSLVYSGVLKTKVLPEVLEKSKE